MASKKTLERIILWSMKEYQLFKEWLKNEKATRL